jgi:exopolysaccharide biosynthesis polyprenyl glycosylphosphotransferase
MTIHTPVDTRQERMSVLGNFVRRNFEPLILSVQVFIDLAVLLLACRLAGWSGQLLSGSEQTPSPDVYRQVWALVAAVCLVTFHAFGMYSPVKSLLNMQEFKAVAKSTVVSFLVFWTLVILLQRTGAQSTSLFYQLLQPLHDQINLGVKLDHFSRLDVVLAFGFILLLTTASRFASFKFIQTLHKRGIGNRNVIIYGAGETGRKLHRKFMLVPTLGLNFVGFADDDEERVGSLLDRSKVLGSFKDLEYLVGLHKVSEVFVALPECTEEHVMRIVEELERIGVKTHVVPRFYHLMSVRFRVENLDSIPLISRHDRRPSLLGLAAKRGLDLLVSSLVVLIGLPVFVVAGILIKRESPGPVFFVQRRIGKDGKPFNMIKFRTMHAHLSGDAPAPNSPYDPRITRIGRYLRRYSLDELPQFLNVLRGDMSVVGPRPEMQFIVDRYSPMERERLRVKPGITGLWQISYARQHAIHDNLDYDLYYIEHQSFLLDLVILALTFFAVAKGTGAY